MHGAAELTRSHSHRDARGAGVVLNPCMGGHRIVMCNRTADLTTEGFQDGAAGGIFDDDELDQVHGGVGEASGRRGKWGHPRGRRGWGGRYRARLSASRSARTLDGMERFTLEPF